MGKYSLELSRQAQKELQAHYKSGNKATIKRIEVIFEELAEHPFTGTGHPEALKYDMTGYWSRQLNKKDRLVYRVLDDLVSVFVVSAIGHYEDK